MSNARIFHPKAFFEFCSQFFLVSFSVYLKMKNRKRHHSIKMIGIKVHFPIMLPNKKATPKLIVIIKNGEARTICFFLNSFNIYFVNCWRKVGLIAEIIYWDSWCFIYYLCLVCYGFKYSHNNAAYEDPSDETDRSLFNQSPVNK